MTGPDGKGDLAPDVRDRLRALEDRSVIRVAPHLLAACVHGLVVAGCLWSWFEGLWPITVLLWIALVFINHAALSRLHEAVHFLLARSKGWNEAGGLVIGTLALTPMSVYRFMHAQHHAHLGGPSDPEFWPYNLPGTPRWLRRGYAWLELLFGWVFTPALYSLRTARLWPRHPARVRRRLVLEWVALGVVWGGVCGVVAWQGWWEALLVGHIVPAWLTGSVQTIRKFTEHLGRTGDSIYEMTRMVVYTGWLGRKLSSLQLFVDHHGTHHRFPAIPYANLPAATELVYGELTDVPVYPHHFAAMRDAARFLGDPRLGSQWEKSVVPAS